MWLICGLGNPGPKYDGTRHNIGFSIVDELARRGGMTAFNKQFKGEAGRVDLAGERCVLLKPGTYMNLSGESVQPAAAFFKIPVENVVVIHDEIDLDLGRLKMKQGGGHGGHNGLRSIDQHLGKNFIRIRAGVGRPRGQSSVSTHVLSEFRQEEQGAADDLVSKCADAVECIIREGLKASQNQFHEAPPKEPKPKKPKPSPQEPSAKEPVSK